MSSRILALGLGAVVWLLPGLPAVAQATALVEATDLAADARRAAAQGVPLVVLKDRKFNATCVSIFAPDRSCQSPISCQKASESARKPPASRLQQST